MTGTHTQNPIYSRITMALMEDTGWYLPNYNMADDFKWGRKLGCDFALRSCLEWMETRQKKGQSIHPFCNKVKRDPLETECTDDRSSVALCNLVQHDNLLPAKFQVRERERLAVKIPRQFPYNDKIVLIGFLHPILSKARIF